ncbi:hypothetical protein CWB89_01005 [Pseudoalteromonas piscicida]|uniref:Tetratricopeptide repeat protein n=1 Tax=Pseudoalteromonas piscicida TaxID=43662 RepID=A0AAQ2IRC0_PSEO7|nr:MULTISPECIES: hypothetical protein [Pseudoalteromonas]MDP4486599.1 hypothetical protein [Pseudoalteromonas piscicida]TMN35854.1 hypothetical protein CWB94_19780 [Pseudoalteromonas piscicida]TMN40847.1 hypothetical protein CWB95_09770 [Pseudoalteromonas piscicida]TMN50513.1 hypothetical protein CWB92_13235 [Pseudoalteromonas piscicida]TMN58165.1 hypothetical protein CWB91_01485 [Pseudoalteromonas piscicida]
MFIKSLIYTSCTVIILYSALTYAQQLNSQITMLESAFYHRQYQQVTKIINTLKDKELDAEIMAVSVAVAQKDDNKEALLNTLIKRHIDNAKVHFTAGNLWYQIKQQSNLFNKLSLVEKSNKHFIRAAELAPNNPEYLVSAAKALAIESGFWDSEKKASKAIVDRLKAMDNRYYNLAFMDYLQNTQNEELALKTVASVGQHYAQDIVLIHRAANLLWTFSAKDAAQRLFTNGCLIEHISLSQLPTWRDACVSSAYLALQQHGDKRRAVDAMERLLGKERVQDEQHIEYLMLQAELYLELKQSENARSTYLQALNLTKVRSTERDIHRALAGLDDT